MYLNSCFAFSVPGCDAEEVCNNTPFETETQYNDCLTAATNTVNDCEAACEPSDNPEDDLTECLGSAEEDTGCAGAFLDADESCAELPIDEQPSCISDAEAADLNCTQGCYQAYNEALITNQKSFDNCAQNCCSSNNEQYQVCAVIADAALQTCLLTPTTTYWTSQLACISEAYDDEGYCCDTTIPAYQECITTAQIAFYTASNDCNVTDQNAQWLCVTDQEKELLGQNWLTNQCYLGIEQTFQTAKKGCDDTQITNNGECQITFEGCTDGDCDDEYAACIAAAQATWNTCMTSPNTSRFDGRLTCCENSFGADQSATCYKACWHSSLCDVPDATTGENACVEGGSKYATLQTCAAGCPSYWTNGVGLEFGFQDCNNCWSEADATFIP
jgi:hypothetical protein